MRQSRPQGPGVRGGRACHSSYPKAMQASEVLYCLAASTSSSSLCSVNCSPDTLTQPPHFPPPRPLAAPPPALWHNVPLKVAAAAARLPACTGAPWRRGRPAAAGRLQGPSLRVLRWRRRQQQQPGGPRQLQQWPGRSGQRSPSAAKCKGECVAWERGEERVVGACSSSGQVPQSARAAHHSISRGGGATAI